MNSQQVIIKRIDRPPRRNLEQELDWFCRVFGISEQRDELGAAILREILRHESKGSGTRSISISRKMRVTRGGAVYHLNKLMATGLIVRKGRDYVLRGENLSDSVEEVEEDVRRVFKSIRRMALEIDRELGMSGNFE
ncbi:MAG: hypothetical protein ABH863_02940 [Candidatus Micrarchaeota archaeon]